MGVYLSIENVSPNCCHGDYWNGDDGKVRTGEIGEICYMRCISEESEMRETELVHSYIPIYVYMYNIIVYSMYEVECYVRTKSSRFEG